MHEAHDPGGKVRLSMLPGMGGGAEFSVCGKYRRYLRRDWASVGKTILFIGMNPSTADAQVDDPTIRREIGFARRLGGARLAKCNIGDYRATHPRDLPSDPKEASTTENRARIMLAARDADIIVMAHGVPPDPLRQAAKDIATEITFAIGRPLHCLGLTKDGWPRHPLYLSKDARLIPYERWRR